MKTITVILLNLIVNALVGFYIFALAFNGDQNFIGKAILLLLVVGFILGTISGLVLKSFKLLDIFISLLPLIGFLSLFIQGSIEKGGIKEIATAGLIFVLPLIFEGGSWFLSVFISKRLQK